MDGVLFRLLSGALLTRVPGICQVFVIGVVILLPGLAATQEGQHDDAGNQRDEVVTGRDVVVVKQGNNCAAEGQQ